MKNIGILIGLLILFMSEGVSQAAWCGTAETVPPIVPIHGLLPRNETVYIPVVFHIVREENANRPSQEQIYSQIDALNASYGGKNYDLFRIAPMFRAFVSNAHIQFCLATKTPNGEPHSGITETITQIPDIGQAVFDDGRQMVHYDQLGGKDAWDPERYLNIWIAEASSFAGRSSFPREGRMEEDGIVLDPDFLGRTSLSSIEFTGGKTAVHEVGHYLGLGHPWGEGGCNSDDGIEDTPLQEYPYFGCPKEEQSSSCGSLDMARNFMQFSNDPCLLYFTSEQVKFMRNVLASFRPELIQSSHMQCIPSMEQQAEKITIFYNPFRKLIQIYGLAHNQTYQAELYTITGQLVASYEFRSIHVPEIRVSHLAKGIYIAVIRGQAINTTYKKILVSSY